VRDPRDREYAELLVGPCIEVQPGWQVLVGGGVLARPLIEEVVAAVARRGAYALVRLSFDGAGMGLGGGHGWLRHAATDLAAVPASLESEQLERCDAIVVVVAPENTREYVDIDPERLTAMQAAYRPSQERMLRHEVPWVVCQYPTAALAQEAAMSTEGFSEFLYGACLLDWEAERDRMRRYAERFDDASEIRIVGEGTDLRLSVEGRKMLVDAAGANMPGGEFFCSPVEDSAAGVITFSEFPAVYAGREVQGIRLAFEGGVVVDASADTAEEFLLTTLDRDDGARRLGELGVGCNPGITRHMKNTLFDEKIDGTVHLALGNGFPNLGGSNVSGVHWDIVKDLRMRGARIELDGEVVQREGAWLV
jgi:aminopeptidase